MNYRQWFFIGIACLLFAGFPHSSVEAANLHAIIVADTLDKTIGSDTNVDLNKMSNKIHEIAKQTKLTLKEEVLAGHSTTPTKLFSKLSKLKVKPDDVVIFFFSGHGYRTPSKTDNNPWPILAFSETGQGVDFDFIAEKLKQLNPRLLIAITDSCNNIIPDHAAPHLVRKAMEKLSPEKIKQNYKQLFLETSGVILIASSEPGEFSWATPNGSLYTLSFLHQLEQEVTTADTANWQDLLGRASTEMNETQHPVYYMDLN